MSHTTLAIGGHFPYMFTNFTWNESLKIQSVSDVLASLCNHNIPPPVTKGLTQITYYFIRHHRRVQRKSKVIERIMLRSIETFSFNISFVFFADCFLPEKKYWSVGSRWPSCFCKGTPQSWNHISSLPRGFQKWHASHCHRGSNSTFQAHRTSKSKQKEKNYWHLYSIYFRCCLT